MSDDSTAYSRHLMAEFKGMLSSRDLNARAADAKAGLPDGTIGHWLRGSRTPDLGRLVDVCIALGIDPRVVLDRALERSGYALAANDPRADEAGADGGDAATEEHGEP